MSENSKIKNLLKIVFLYIQKESVAKRRGTKIDNKLWIHNLNADFSGFRLPAFINIFILELINFNRLKICQSAHMQLFRTYRT